MKLQQRLLLSAVAAAAALRASARVRVQFPVVEVFVSSFHDSPYLLRDARMLAPRPVTTKVEDFQNYLAYRLPPGPFYLARSGSTEPFFLEDEACVLVRHYLRREPGLFCGEVRTWKTTVLKSPSCESTF